MSHSPSAHTGWRNVNVRFSIPTVINRRVYVGTRSELDVYGLLPQEK